MINAGDIDGAIAKIGCGIKSEDGIIRAITNKTQNTIERLEKAVENEEKQIENFNKKLEEIDNNVINAVEDTNSLGISKEFIN